MGVSVAATALACPAKTLGGVTTLWTALTIVRSSRHQPFEIASQTDTIPLRLQHLPAASLFLRLHLRRTLHFGVSCPRFSWCSAVEHHGDSVRHVPPRPHKKERRGGKLTPPRHLILLSRQGKVVGGIHQEAATVIMLTHTAPRQVVYDPVTKGKGQDCQGRLPAGPPSTHPDVQFPRI